LNGPETYPTKRIAAISGGVHSIRKITGAQIPLHATSPPAYKREIHRSADCRTRQRNNSRNPLFRGFLPNLHRKPLAIFGASFSNNCFSAKSLP
jgi:hypothetical protein